MRRLLVTLVMFCSFAAGAEPAVSVDAKRGSPIAVTEDPGFVGSITNEYGTLSTYRRAGDGSLFSAGKSSFNYIYDYVSPEGNHVTLIVNPMQQTALGLTANTRVDMSIGVDLGLVSTVSAWTTVIPTGEVFSSWASKSLGGSAVGAGEPAASVDDRTAWYLQQFITELEAGRFESKGCIGAAFTFAAVALGSVAAIEVAGAAYVAGTLTGTAFGTGLGSTFISMIAAEWNFIIECWAS